MLPRSSSKHYRNLQRLKAVVVLSARRAWRRMEPGGNWSEQYREDVGPKLTALVIAAQVAATRESDTYIAEVLNELNFGPATQPGLVLPQAFAGWAGDGRPVATLLEQSVVRAGRAYNAARADTPEAVLSRTPLESAAEDALAEAERWMEGIVETILADTARAAEEAAMAPREWVEGYVRMLQPPSCSRCAILAGRFYLWNDGFERHPRCDCIHIPAQEADYNDLRVNPDRYFASLPTAAELNAQHPDLTVKMRREGGLYSQEDIFTEAGAKAIRDGADISQVINARRGVTTAAINQRGWIPKGRMIRTEAFGRGIFTTTEGVTKRGRGRKSMGSGRPFRLMPESIYEIAGGDRAEAIRLLKLYGFIVP